MISNLYWEKGGKVIIIEKLEIDAVIAKFLKYADEISSVVILLIILLGN